MKKFFKFLAVSVCIAVLAMSLTGCNAIDEMRAAHGTWTNDGNIKLGEHEYIKLPECETLSPFFDEDKYVSVTEPGVPLLLSTMLGEIMSFSDDEKILQSVSDDYSTHINYCREDAYEEIKSLIEGGVITDGYCYFYEVYDEESEGLWENEWYVLSDIEVDAVNEVIMTVTPTETQDASYDLYYECDYWISLEACSDDLLFKDEGYELCKSGDAYFLSTASMDMATYYVVPDDLAPVFSDIMSAYIEAEQEMQSMYEYY